MYGTLSWTPGTKNSDTDHYLVYLRDIEITARVENTTHSFSKLVDADSIVVTNNMAEISVSVSTVNRCGQESQPLTRSITSG